MKVMMDLLAALLCSLFIAPCGAEVANVVVDHRHHPQHHHKHKKQHSVAASSESGSAHESKHSEDSLPHLPAVASMLGQASETLKSISDQASTLEDKVSQMQKDNSAKMSRQKAVFDRRLESQEEGTRAEIARNQDVSKENAQLEKENTAVRKHAKELQTSNRLMRIELQTLQSKLGVSRDFVASSLTITDDSKAKELLVLKTKDKDSTEDKHDGEDSRDQDDDDDKEDGDAAGGEDDDSDDGDDDESPSFLAVAAQTKRAETKRAETKRAENFGDDAQMDDLDAGEKPEIVNPKDLLKVLQKGVENLATEEKDGEAKLKNLFLSDFRAGLKRHTTILAEQKALNSTQSILKDRQAHLKAAEAHLQHTKSHLEERLRGLGLFLQKLAHVALAPTNEAPKQIKALPSSISIPSEQAPSKISDA